MRLDREVEGGGDKTLGVFVGFADVDEEGGGGGRVGGEGFDLPPVGVSYVVGEELGE